MNPECCNYEMTEVESKFMNELGEYEVVAYECQVCKRQIDLNGEEIEDGKHSQKPTR